MQCTISGSNVKFLGKAIHSLSRIGDDAYIEAIDKGILLQTVNSARSAYVCFTFTSPFFFKFSKSTDVKCKVSLKSWLLAFRSLPALDKFVESCLIDTKSVKDTLLVEFSCRKSLKKVYHLPFIENETVQTSFPNNTYQCRFMAQSRLLTDGIQNFSNSVEEVTLMIYSDRLTFKNYVDDEPDPNKIVHTELTLESDEFDEYEVQQETEVTFCLKELRALLNFAEGTNVPVNIYCQGAGRPIMFSVQSTSGVKSEFVLATLADSPASQGSGFFVERNSTTKSTAQTRKESYKKKLGNKAQNRKAKVASDGSLPELLLKDPGTPSAVSDILSKASECTSLQNTVNDEVFQNERNSNITLPNNRGQSIEVRDAGTDNPNVNVEANDIVPSTPPRKKLMRFIGLSQTSLPPDPDEILVPASDDEDDW